MNQQNDSMVADEKISQKLQIFMSARNLTGYETINSYVVVYLEEPGQKKKVVLKTKVHMNDLNPNYGESLIIQFIFQVKQKLTFQIYHQPSKLVGIINTSVGQIFGSPVNGFIRPIKDNNGKQTGKIILRCEKIQKGIRKTFIGQISAEGLPNLKWWYFFGGTSPFFRIFRKRKQGDQILVYQSQVINRATNPDWRQFKIPEQKLCRLEEQAQLQVRIYNFQGNGNHTLIGIAYFSMAKLQKKQKKFDILLNKKEKRGKIIFKKSKRIMKRQFGQYIEKGLQLALTTCIDFTASNGHPDSKDSLHFSTLSKRSQYQEAMSQVLDILLDYDYDKLVPCFGFGAQVKHPKLNSGNLVHHCFPINGDQENPFIYQKQNILKTYRTILSNVKFSGPTLFSELLKKAMKICRQFEENPQKTQYMILFILTDGQIHDKLQVIDLIIKCNKLPISLIIVGIGNSDFPLMRQLDDDDCTLVDSNGNRTQRDLVQFVKFADFKNNGVMLAKEVLEQLPRQVEEYFQLVGIKPEMIKRKVTDSEQQMFLKNYNR